ncbi:hypothetical protein BEN47_18635 [Hymenobacter lapidarius]|uniref:Uncharacterized protein n=1 Tax=Hymenobacter lapidarius TaxID=1908237 RepID=A0A1G1SUI1_9BACT|nr:hypothetical protein [Hymenobacter lapidarius]OGX82246.1 hypothetical protein BEN47_18635 [Hymenobacter lapidarius]
MSDLHNPLFDEEKEFLERKKLEYERALRGDVDHIKDQSKTVGKVALVGAGLAGGIWLISKAFGGKKRKRKFRNEFSQDDNEAGWDDFGADDTNDFDADNGFGSEYYTAGNGKRYKSVTHSKSAAASAQVFMAQSTDESDDDAALGIAPGKGAAQPTAASRPEHEPSPFDTEDFKDDPFQDLPFDDSRRLPASHAFDEDDDQPAAQVPRQPNMMAGVLQSFLQSDTGKILVAQAAAVVLAMVTKKVSEFFPADKNADLANSPDPAPAENGFAPVDSLATPSSPDAFTHSATL